MRVLNGEAVNLDALDELFIEAVGNIGACEITRL